MSDAKTGINDTGKGLLTTIERIFTTDLPHRITPAMEEASFKESARNLPRILVEILLIAYAVRNTYLVTDTVSDSIKNTLFYKACIAIMIVVILAGRVNIISARLLPEAGFCYATYLIFKKVTGYTIENAGVDYYPSCVWKIIAWDIALLLLLEIVVHKRYRSVKNTNWWFAGLVTVSTTYALIVDIRYLNYYVLPIVVLYFIKLGKAEWHELCESLAWGFIAGGGVLFAKSFIEVPLATDAWYKTEATYFGTFLDTENSGALVAGMMICAMYIIVDAFKCRGLLKRIIKVTLAVGVILVSSWITIKINNFTGIAGTAMAAVAAILVYCFKKSRKLGIVIVITGLVLMGTLGVFAWKASIAAKERYNDTERTETLTKFETRVVVLQGGEFVDATYHVSDSDFVNAINRISSGRIGIWKHYLQQVTLWGQLPAAGEKGWSTHSAYLYWLVRFGIIGGVIFILRFIYCLIGSVVNEFFQDRDDFGLCLLWMAFFTAFFLSSATSIVWQCMCIVFFLLMQYPFLTKQRNRQD